MLRGVAENVARWPQYFVVFTNAYASWYRLDIDGVRQFLCLPKGTTLIKPKSEETLETPIDRLWRVVVLRKIHVRKSVPDV